MGTRSLIIMQDENGEDIAVLCRQYDGYYSRYGAELKEFLSGFKIINGIDKIRSKRANGAECLAAQIVAHFKTEIGTFYLYSANTRNLREEYRYFIRPDGDRINLVVTARNWQKKTDEPEWIHLYSGNVESFNPEEFTEL